MENKVDNIFNFNSISDQLSSEEIDFLKKLYAYYHKKTWCYKRAYKYLKHKDLFLSVSAIFLTALGGAVSAATINFIPLPTISLVGIVLHGYNKKKNYKKRIELCKFAYTSYQKVLIDLRSYLRGDQYDSDQVIHHLNWIDKEITDLCPPIDDYYNKSYDKYHIIN
ncbi:TPA_asm: SLATT [Trichoplax MELD virus]|nr:TPA_asm: SLATT [Trichoplax MELD virus]